MKKAHHDVSQRIAASLDDAPYKDRMVMAHALIFKNTVIVIDLELWVSLPDSSDGSARILLS